MSSPVITLKNLEYQAKGAHSFELNITDFRLNQGEKLLITGASGSGKSTFLNLLTGVLRPRKGKITILSQTYTSLTPAGLDSFRGENFGIIFQTFNLIPYASVRENILLAIQFAKQRKRRVSEDIETHIYRMMHRLGLEPSLATRKAEQLSIGQQQRVAMLRALLGTPPIVIADEPTSALDTANATEFMNLLVEESTQNNQTLILVSHDESLHRFTDRTLSMDELNRVS